MVDVACGARHTAAILDGGAIYCWGDSTRGQCGGSQDMYKEPHLVNIIDGAPPCEHSRHHGPGHAASARMLQVSKVVF